ncbi:MAG: N-6 DNA methylase [Treponema sp.]|jgi:predicted RNA methylase|nr:N-6 DNA methylase [Treponema sp.]
MNDFLQKEELGKDLGVSLATVNNWIKTQVIPPPDLQNHYSSETYNFIIAAIKNNQTRLNSRANRKHLDKNDICFLGITDKKRKKLLTMLISRLGNTNLTFNEGVLALSFSLLLSAGLIEKKWKINDSSRLDTFLSGWLKETKDHNLIQNLFLDIEIQNYDDDLLGAFYQSIQNISSRADTGSYYTPSYLLKGIKIKSNRSILDPCCGSGGILLNVLAKDHNPETIFAKDIDETALKICYINLILFFNDKNIKPNISKQDITVKTNEDLFTNNECREYDYIITNPPWGSKYSAEKKRALIKNYPELLTSEVFSIALYNSYKKLSAQGELYFFLPYSFLNVATHKNIRKILFNKNNSISIKLLGNAFKGVLSESILLNIKKIPSNGTVSIEDAAGKQYRINLENICSPDFIVSANINTEDNKIIDKLYNSRCKTLKENTIFALGIVLGDNKKHLFAAKNNKNFESIYRGKEIGKYRLLENEYCIDFNPGLYQQVAPIEYYRQKKIVYRFINDSIICTLDTNNNLILNSANLFISFAYPMETIVSLFNSDIYTFVFRKKFNSRKVLKSHIQDLPIPLFDEKMHKYIFNLYSGTFNKNNANIASYQKEIDKIICDYFLISNQEYQHILEAL